jgi:peroxiredoxin/mono/diheme cytochrome c family protein
MRWTAFALVALASAFSTAQEPKRNPFRDGSGAATTEQKKSDPVKQGPRVIRAAEAGIGAFVPDVAFTDLAGKPGKLSDFKTAKLLVVAFLDVGCPVGKKYGPTLAKLEKEFAAKDVAFLFVDPVASDEADDLKKAVSDRGLRGRVVLDADGKLASAFGATTTTEVFLLDSARTVQYRGAIDDQYGVGYSRETPSRHYLAAAISDSLAGKAPVVAATTAPGCELSVKPGPAAEATYHARIERLLQANCVECHRKGGVAPFALETYEQVASRKAAIKRVVEGGTMPPWFAAPPAKGEHSPWLNDRSLAAADKAALLAWLAGDLKKGDPADAPRPRSFASGWLIGTPDATFQIPKPIAVKATGTMPYQNVSVDTNFEEDRWVSAIEVQPSAREVTHHVLVFAAPKGAPRAVGEGQGFFAVYVPGNSTLIYPEGFAKKVPKNATLHFQIHYTPNGTATQDQPKIGMIFAKEPPRHEVRVAALVNAKFEIPAGAENHKVEAAIPVPFEAKVLAFFPHAHLRGKAARYDVRTPDGSVRNLLDVPHYDFNWQLTYRYAEPAAVPRGSRITYTAWYDNSEKNPANPDPKKIVKWGPQTFEEMHLGYLEFYIDR